MYPLILDFLYMTPSEANEKMESTLEFLRTELSKIRTGRATPEMFESVEVEVYESKMPVQHIATISVPDARTVVIQPWDSNNIEAIERAIATSDLGVNPVVDGEIVRISIPALTQERRQEFVKEMKEKVEDAKVSVRQIRQKVMNAFDDELKAGGVSEDDIDRSKSEFEKEVSKTIDKVDEIAKKKEDELMSL